jgi:hypothetical protein
MVLRKNNEVPELTQIGKILFVKVYLSKNQIDKL